MMAHAEALEFEQAAEVRDRIGALSRVLHQQSVEDNAGGDDQDVDILAVQGGGRPRLRQPGDGARRPSPRRPAYFPKHVDEATALSRAEAARSADAEPTPEVQVLEAFIAQHYLDAPCRRCWC